MGNELNDCRIIVVRRGEFMRLIYPMTMYGLETTSPPELALSAIGLFMELQAENPGRADMPITSKTGQVALYLPEHDSPLEDEPLWAVLAGHWQRYDVLVPGGDTPNQRLPAVSLNLMDLR